MNSSTTKDGEVIGHQHNSRGEKASQQACGKLAWGISFIATLMAFIATALVWRFIRLQSTAVKANDESMILNETWTGAPDGHDSRHLLEPYIPNDRLCVESTFTLDDSDYNELCKGTRTGQGIVLAPGTDAWCFENEVVKKFIPEYACLCEESVDCDRVSVLGAIERLSAENCTSDDPCRECVVTLDDDEYMKLCTGHQRRALQTTNFFAPGHIVAETANQLAIAHHHINSDTLGGSSRSGIEFIRSDKPCERSSNDRPFFRRTASASGIAYFEYGIPVSSEDAKITIHVHSLRMGEFRVKGTYKTSQVAGEPRCTYIAAWPYVRIVGLSTLTTGCGVSLWTLDAIQSPTWRQLYPYQLGPALTV